MTCEDKNQFRQLDSIGLDWTTTLKPWVLQNIEGLGIYDPSNHPLGSNEDENTPC